MNIKTTHNSILKSKIIDMDIIYLLDMPYSWEEVIPKMYTENVTMK